MTRSIAAALALFACSALAAAKPNPYLTQAKVFYQGLEYEKCLTRLDQATKGASAPAEEADVQLYFGLCNFNIGNLDEAKRRFDLALALDPNLELPPYTSPRIVATFEDSRAKVASRRAAQAPQEKKVAAADSPTKRELTPKPDDSNRPELVERGAEGPHLAAPLALAGTGAIAAGAFAYFGLQAKAAESEANDARFESDAFAATDRAHANARLANVAAAVAGAAVIAAVVTYFVTN